MSWLLDSILSSAIGSNVNTASGFLGFGGKKQPDRVSGVDSPDSISTPVDKGSLSVAPSTSESSVSIESSSKLVQPAAFFKYGHPGPHVDVDFRQEYIAAFDRRMRNPAYVIEHITPQSISRSEGVDRKKSTFTENESIPIKFRARLADYFRSGYDRGHMAPAANAKFSQSAMDETFYLTNIAPQVGEGFNRDYWAHFEDFCRRLTQKYNSVRIVTGPLYLPKKYPDGKFRVTYEVIGNPPNIAVPTHFYKLIVAESPITSPQTQDIAVGAFLMPNEPIPNTADLKRFYVPIDAIERASGLVFLSDFPDKQKKDLCREVECKILVREFTKALPEPPQPLALPVPRQ
ncbi:hypothetical protein POJ06DRAFT_245097 [Lipomyces tetrasporus]|uniref:Endonuclease n=1 Tax=Lipomyces tetrasporus TaxID=54092 RepID=A0AAD7QW46_9ASCO|nr:uncharacterized protein POJ06DRAFT_245097 [Lipomyces tetrasporus]KAJ8102597.1 hypothetical protein POJ06DRAFT_245097 [Lipomyces tetrasporus]